jgi:hypothetical protein
MFLTQDNPNALITVDSDPTIEIRQEEAFSQNVYVGYLLKYPAPVSVRKPQPWL